MFVIIDVVNLAFRIYTFIMLASIVMSWLVSFGIVSYSNPNVRQAMQLLHKLTEPVLAPIRRILPPIGGLDFSPVVVFIALPYIQSWVNLGMVSLFYGG
jgi:YggT family protein